MTLVLPTVLSSKRSLSPVSNISALPSFAKANRKLSFGSLQIVMVLFTSIISPYTSNSSMSCSMSSSPKDFLNFGLSATVINSSISSRLKSNLIRPFFILSSSFFKIVCDQETYPQVGVNNNALNSFCHCDLT